MNTKEKEKARLAYALNAYAEAVELKDKRIDELYERITELNAVIDEVRIACDEGGCMIGTKYCDFISSQTSRITKLKQLLADAVRFIAYAQSKCVHGGEAIAKEIEENLNQEG